MYCIPPLPQAHGAAQVQVAKSIWSCAAQNFGDLTGDSLYLGLGTGEGRGKRGRGRGRARPSAAHGRGAGLGTGLSPWATQTQPSAREKPSN